MNNKVLSSVLAIILTLFFIMKNSLDFNPVQFHCDNYVLNSYLYIFLSMAIMIAVIFSMEDFDIDVNNLFAGNSKFLLLVLSMILIFAVTMMDAKNFFTKHLLWLSFIALMGVFVYPVFKENESTFYHSAITTIILVSGLSIISILNPSMIKDSWEFYLFSSLIILLITSIVEQLLRNWKILKTGTYNKLLSYITIILFSFWILFDTKQIIQNADKCGIEIDPDYINQSLTVFLDSLNIFAGISNVQN